MVENVIFAFLNITFLSMQQVLQYFQGFVSLFYPKTCVSCGNVLLFSEKLMCTHCHYNLPQTHFLEQDETAMDDIFKGRVRVEKAFALYYFQKAGGVQKMIHLLKYRNRPDIGVFLGNLLGHQLLNSELLSKLDVIVPVPLHPKKMKQRGYNQSEMIANGVAEIVDIEVNTSSVVREEYTSTQTKKNRISRWQNVKSGFKVVNPELIENKHVLVVDDIITTGATIEACVHNILQVSNVVVSVACIGYAKS